ncbi:metal ABC transporter solute-binding protein, Zn/Mn family [Guptibacillus hwajinpoensis]|uniref:Zinc transport system substrate-binding protein n=1 Tax=Guptibacillus hwajinpoensis TaxID=208199 RepID=A0ABU0JYW9_9BACL|nr:zinc ABC transporter substrate-binding protein [Alkalihalobacillus hemicentroti]MDQ0481107.1 zinc transport system substrate-binding protein [Alkalihalobacillus hemicentroti]
MNLKYGKILLFVITVLLLAACGEEGTRTTASNESGGEKKLNIYTTLFPIEDFTRKIGGKHVQVVSILPAGSDAHTYEPTTQTMINVAEADAFIYNGLGMESYAEAIADSVGKDVRMVEASSGIETLEHNEEHSEDEHSDEHEEHSEGEHSHDHGDQDPHLWLDPIKAIGMAENIKETLIELNPEAKEDFEANFQSVKSELTKLDKEFANIVDSKDHPDMIVSHAAFGYWENRYGIHQIAISGLSPSNEPSQKALEEIIETAKDKKIKYVLFEQNVTPKVAKSLQSEIGAKALRLHNLSVLTEEDINNKEDYFSLMRKNLGTLDQALK